MSQLRLALTSKIAALVKAGQPVPQAIAVRALLDTGADRSAVASHVLQHFQLALLIYGRSQTAGGAFQVGLFQVDLTVHGSSGAAGPVFAIPDLLVSELTVSLPVDVLIGLDVLRECLLILDGPGQQFIVAF